LKNGLHNDEQSKFFDNMTNVSVPEGYELKTHDATTAGRQSTWVSVWVNVMLSTGQVLAGIASQSQGLIADGIHSLSDLLADFVVLIAGHHSKKEADEDHHYGHHRYENAASLALGVLLLVVAIGMIWSAVKKLEDPDQIPTVHQVALWVAGAALLAKEALFRYMLTVATRIRSSMLVANAWHARSDALSSFVVAVGILGNMFGYPLLDPLAALVVGLMVGKMGWKFGWCAMNDLMDRAVSEEESAAIRATVIATPGVRGVHDLRTRKVGDFAIVDVHLEVDASISVLAGHDIAVEARRRVLEKHQVLDVMTHLDPYGHDDLG
jgi:cation diffusion facilitator family transporter